MTGIGWQGTAEGIADQTDTHANVGGPELVAQDAEGKHVVLGVEDFVPGRHAYLRLGAASTRAGAPTDTMLGEDLATLIQGFTDDTRDRGAPSDSPPCPAEAYDGGSAATFARVDGAPDATGHATQAPRTGLDPRIVESAILHAKGGWRDHSDGNRITTTRGDKVEVIQGNYKLVVLGRQSLDALVHTGMHPAAARAQLMASATGFDFSGGVNDEGGDPAFASDPDVQAPSGGYDADHPDPAATRAQSGLAVEYQWQKDSDGKWSWTITSNQGADGASGNYRIINQTFVDHQEDNYGGGAGSQRVSNVIQRTWAKTIYTQTVALAVQTYTSGGVIENNAALTGPMLTINAVGAMVGTDACGMIGLAQASINMSFYIGPVFTAWLPITADFHLGPHSDAHAGAHFDTHSGLHQETRFGVHMEEHLGPHIDMHVGTHFEMDEHQVQFKEGDVFHVHASSGTVDWDSASGTGTTVTPSQVTMVTPEASLRMATSHSLV
jgi:hypothetical protein